MYLKRTCPSIREGIRAKKNIGKYVLSRNILSQQATSLTSFHKHLSTHLHTSTHNPLEFSTRDLTIPPLGDVAAFQAEKDECAHLQIIVIFNKKKTERFCGIYILQVELSSHPGSVVRRGWGGWGNEGIRNPSGEAVRGQRGFQCRRAGAARRGPGVCPREGVRRSGRGHAADTPPCSHDEPQPNRTTDQQTDRFDDTNSDPPPPKLRPAS